MICHELAKALRQLRWDTFAMASFAYPTESGASSNVCLLFFVAVGAEAPLLAARLWAGPPVSTSKSPHDS